MPFTLIKGTYHVQHYSPDGDSIRFRPDNMAFLKNLSGSLPAINARNHVQLRIEAIDALETHYNPPGGGAILHQPLTIANLARNKLLAFVGITHIEWGKTQRTVVSANDATRGYIISRSIEKYGRPVAFVFAGEAKEKDGSEVFLDIARLRQSYNFLALEKGYAYPTYYEGLFYDLRKELTAAVSKARKSKRGVYSLDRSQEGFEVTSLKSITQEYTILPKLFRRLSEYIVNYGTAKGFKNKLEESKEKVLDLRSCHFTHFDTFIEQKENSMQIKLTRYPEELVFDPMPFRPKDVFSTLLQSDIV
jgi:endonuclease YncB( thermonuclease family)